MKLTRTYMILALCGAMMLSAQAFWPEVEEQLPEPEPPVVVTEAPSNILIGVPGPEPVTVTIEALGEYKLTSYCACPKCCGIWSEQHPSRIGTGYQQLTRSGVHPEGNHTIAADWDVLPAGTQVLIDGTVYTVEDTGNAVKGNHIDIFQDSHAAACAWGVKYEEVYKVCVN